MTENNNQPKNPEQQKNCIKELWLNLSQIWQAFVRDHIEAPDPLEEMFNQNNVSNEHKILLCYSRLKLSEINLSVRETLDLRTRLELFISEFIKNVEFDQDKIDELKDFRLLKIVIEYLSQNIIHSNYSDQKARRLFELIRKLNIRYLYLLNSQNSSED